MKIYIVPAAYNEKDNIAEMIRIFEEEVFPTIKGHDMNILIADDNSPDGTGDVVRTLMKKYKNCLICGISFTGTNMYKRKFCSIKCSSENISKIFFSDLKDLRNGKLDNPPV
jgi:glycosyltransferase involved in cell wall biosynthesis